MENVEPGVADEHGPNYRGPTRPKAPHDQIKTDAPDDCRLVEGANHRCLRDLKREGHQILTKCRRRRVDKPKTNIKAMIKDENDCDDPYMMPLASKSAISASDSLSSPP